MNIDFAVIGFQKCGTASLRKWLSDRPNIVVHPNEIAPGAMPEFLRNEEDYDDWFSEKFKKYDKVGLVSPSYSLLDYRTAAKNLYYMNPQMKIITIFRDRAERAFSAWNMAKLVGAEKRTFSQAIDDCINTGTFSIEEDKWLMDSYLDAGMYNNIINTYEYFFPKKNIISLPLNLMGNVGVMSQLANFLGTVASSEKAAKFPTVNAAPGYCEHLVGSDRKKIGKYYINKGEIK